MAIIGSRSLKPTFQHILCALHELCGRHPACGPVTQIVSGGAYGVDKRAAEFAKANGIEVLEIKPNYIRYGKRAPLIRNAEIVQKADMLIAFHDGKSTGTLHTVGLAKKKGIPVLVVEAER